MAIIGSTTSKGFDLPSAYINIGVINYLKVPFAENELQVIFRLFKDEETFKSAPWNEKNDWVLESFTVYLDANGIDPENFTQYAYDKLKVNPRFSSFIDK